MITEIINDSISLKIVENGISSSIFKNDIESLIIENNILFIRADNVRYSLNYKFITNPVSASAEALRALVKTMCESTLAAETTLQAFKAEAKSESDETQGKIDTTNSKLDTLNAKDFQRKQSKMF